MRTNGSTQGAGEPYPALIHVRDDLWRHPVTSETYLVPRPKRRNRSNTRDGFVMVYLDTEHLQPLLDSPSSVELRVFLHLVAAMQYRQCFDLNRAALGRRLGVSRQAVSAAVVALVESGMLCVDGVDPDCHWVNPDVAHRGDEVDRRWTKARACCGRH